MGKQIDSVDHSKMKLGKHPPKHDSRTLKLSSYLVHEELPTVPDEWNWGQKIVQDKWGMMHNKKIECCTCAAAGHFIMAWTSNTGKLFKPTDKSILQTYSAITGYDPKTGENDTGAYSLDVLKHWRKYDINGKRIFAFALLEPKNHLLLKQTIYMFGGCFVGLGLPLSSVKQPVWSVPPEGIKGNGGINSWGGHAVLITGYSENGLRTITWGKEKIMTWDFWETYSEESYAVFSEDFILNEKTPAGIDVHTLRKDLDILKKK